MTRSSTMGVAESDEVIVTVNEPPGCGWAGRKAFHTAGAPLALSPKSQPCSHSVRFCASTPLQDWQIVPLASTVPPEHIWKLSFCRVSCGRW